MSEGRSGAIPRQERCRTVRLWASGGAHRNRHEAAGTEAAEAVAVTDQAPDSRFDLKVNVMDTFQCHVLETLGAQLCFCDRARCGPVRRQRSCSVLKMKAPASAGSRARAWSQCDEHLVVFVRLCCVCSVRCPTRRLAMATSLLLFLSISTLGHPVISLTPASRNSPNVARPWLRMAQKMTRPLRSTERADPEIAYRQRRNYRWR